MSEPEGILQLLKPVRPAQVQPAAGQAAGVDLSQAEKRRRVRRGRADARVPIDGTQGDQGAAKIPPLTLSEALGMVSSTARGMWEAMGCEETRAADKKHASIALGVMLDKWAMLSGRPTQVIQWSEAEGKREAIHSLAERIRRVRAAI